MSNQLRRTSGPERTLTQRELAAMRPAVETPRRQPRRVASRSEVTSGIICECGERFSEAQALEFMRHLRAEFGEILNWAARERERRRRDVRRFSIRAKTMECPPEQHGKFSGYNRYGCRCDRCKNAQKIKNAARPERQPRICACGCGEMTGGGIWKPGHHMKAAASRAG